MSAPARLILVHKQRTSARIRFLRFADGVVAPDAFPKLSQVLGEDEGFRDSEIVVHPAMAVNQVSVQLGLSKDDIELETDFSSFVDTPEGVSAIYLGRITTMDPPFDAAQKIGGSFIAITEGRDLPPTELELLRRAYQCVME